MKEIQRVGPFVGIVEARSPENLSSVVTLGVKESTLQESVQRNLSIKCAQLYGIILLEGLMPSVHAFRGLNRPLMHADDMEADRNILVYSWRPQFDYLWRNGRFNGNPTARIPPPGVVFVVLVKEEKEPQMYPGHGLIFGTIEHWSWVSEDPSLAHAPIKWSERYAKKLWSREV